MTVKKVKIDRRYWDPAIFSYEGFKLMKRHSFADLRRIEALRWRILLKHHNKYVPEHMVFFKAVMTRGEAFIASEEFENPVRLKAGHRGISRDYNFWNVEEGDVPLVELAKVGETIEKERRVTPEALQLGADYTRTASMLHTSFRRIGTINRILQTAVHQLKIIERYHHPDEAPRRVAIRINGRVYRFTSDIHRDEKIVWENWPDPGIEVIEVPEYKIDASLVGAHVDLVRTRFGEPPLVLKTRKDLNFGNVWIYGSVGVKLDKHCSSVEKFLDSKEVIRLLRRMK